MGQAKEKQAPVQSAEEDDILELPERSHLEGCPMDDDDLEWHEANATAGAHAGWVIEVIRCVRCGGQTEKRKHRIGEEAS